MEASLRVPVTDPGGSPLCTRHERQRQLVLGVLGVSRALGMRATHGVGEQRSGDGEGEPDPGSERRERERLAAWKVETVRFDGRILYEMFIFDVGHRTDSLPSLAFICGVE
ncbi:unnamed protein product [Lampetra planeri]